MAGDQRVYNMTLLLQNPGGLSSSSSPPFESLYLPNSSPSLLGCRSMVKFEDVHRGEESDKWFQYGSLDCEKSCNEDLGEEFRRPEKKRRLAANQVEFLEKSFEVENKLEPERKIQLARELGLHPRQIAIWFQNRRARWKTRLLEKDYDVLKASYKSLQSDYDNMFKETEKLKNKVLTLTEEMLLKEKDMGNSQLSETVKPSQPQIQNAIVPNSKLNSVEQDQFDDVQVVVCKQEDLCSSNSYVSDSGSTLCINNVGAASKFETADSCHVSEPDQSDLSQDEDEKLMSDSFLCPVDQVPKHEDGAHQYPFLPRENAYNYGLETTEDQPLWFWSY